MLWILRASDDMAYRQRVQVREHARGLAEAEVATPSDEVWRQVSISCCRASPRVRRVRSRICVLNLSRAFDAMRRSLPSFEMLNPRNLRRVSASASSMPGSIWTWWREGGKFHIEKTATIPPEPVSKDQLPALLQGFGAVPPLVTDIDLSMDDRFLYVACWGTGEMRQYDVTDPRKPKLAGSVHLGGIARRTPHPSGKVCAGGPQMVEISRDGKRVYCWSPSSNGSDKSRSAPASWSSGSVSSGLSTGAIRECWRGYGRRGWGSGPLLWRSRMARD
jgi:selenium-binding protein 1